MLRLSPLLARRVCQRADWATHKASCSITPAASAELAVALPRKTSVPVVLCRSNALVPGARRPLPVGAADYFSDPSLPFIMKEDADVGRYLIARRGWNVGDVVYMDQPYLSALVLSGTAYSAQSPSHKPSHTAVHTGRDFVLSCSACCVCRMHRAGLLFVEKAETHCQRCLCWLGASAFSSKEQCRCSSCGYAQYCSSRCMAASADVHAVECGVIKALKGAA